LARALGGDASDDRTGGRENACRPVFQVPVLPDSGSLRGTPCL
jgi:hypothetical protein